MDRFFPFSETGGGDFPLLEQVKSGPETTLIKSALDKSVAKDIFAPFIGVFNLPRESVYLWLDRLNISPEYRECITERFEKMDPDLRSVYNRFADRLVCLDADYPNTAHFSRGERGFRVDQSYDKEHPLGAGCDFFHESAHMLDWLIGGENGVEQITSLRKMTEAVRADLDDALGNIMHTKDCSRKEAMKLLSEELESNEDLSNCVSDVFGGLTKNKVTGVWGHSAEYWAARDAGAVGMEAFAEITQQRVCYPEAYAYTQKLMPRTCGLYQSIISNAAR